MAARAGVVSGLVLTCPARPPGLKARGPLFRAYLGKRFDVGCECFNYNLVHRFLLDGCPYFQEMVNFIVKMTDSKLNTPMIFHALTCVYCVSESQRCQGAARHGS